MVEPTYTMAEAFEYLGSTEKVIDLGGGHYAAPTTCYGHAEVGVTGFIEVHPRPDNGEFCMGGVQVKGHGHNKRGDGSPVPEWDMSSLDPLTLSPSILCRACGAHGWVREGVWVDA